jgi:hypothetical protein
MVAVSFPPKTEKHLGRTVLLGLEKECSDGAISLDLELKL